MHNDVMSFSSTAGLASAVILPVIGVAVGVTQIVRGVANTPDGIRQKQAGKHWDMATHSWVENPGQAITIDDEVRCYCGSIFYCHPVTHASDLGSFISWAASSEQES